MKYGFIGCGNMGGALARALTQNTKDVVIADQYSNVQALAASMGCLWGSNEEAASSQRIFLAVKPNVVPDVLEQLRPVLEVKQPLLISMAAGVSIAQLEQWAGVPLPIIRIMPNTPAAVGQGMILYCTNALVQEADLEDFLKDMSRAGRFDRLDEKLIDAGSALSGCGPAYMYMFLEALADGAVACGLPRAKAYTYAAATMAGAAQMVLSSGTHPGALKDAVCSPGGSTIAGVKALEENGFRGAVMDCVAAAYEKTLDLGKGK
jgi:pyrroline-5-carboxylate reductase